MLKLLKLAAFTLVIFLSNAAFAYVSFSPPQSSSTTVFSGATNMSNTRNSPSAPSGAPSSPGASSQSGVLNIQTETPTFALPPPGLPQKETKKDKSDKSKDTGGQDQNIYLPSNNQPAPPSDNIYSH